MGLPTEILRFFSTDYEDAYERRYRTLGEFVRQPEYVMGNMKEIIRIVQKFKFDGDLLSMGFLRPGLTNNWEKELLTCVKFDDEIADYGSYDFAYLGFFHIANYFSSSVRPIVITKKDGDLDIGTGFLLFAPNILITAGHVIKEAEYVHITNQQGILVEVSEVIFPKNPNIDIAIIVISNPVFEGIPFFKLHESQVLENVMTIGYPPIPGFDALQLYETSSINNSYKFSKGQIVGHDNAYLDGLEYLIINAKVKGGNSGSPVINHQGFVVGLIVQIPTDPHDSSKLDSLGYGVVTPASEIVKFFPASGEVKPYKSYQVVNSERGFKMRIKGE